MKRISSLITFILILNGAQIARAATYSCSSCSDCNTVISSTASGDIVELTDDIQSEAGSACIDFGTRNNVTLDGKGFEIRYSGTGYNGIYLGSIANTGITVRNITVRGFTRGIYLVWGSGNHVENSKIFENGTGIELYSASNNILAGNFFKQNSTALSILYDSDQNIIQDSSFVRNYNSAISFFPRTGSGDPEDNQVYNNIFNNYGAHDIAIQSIQSDETRDLSGISFILNEAIDCDQDANVVGCGCIAGNYWQRPAGLGHSETCNDSDTDTICDSAYTIAHNSAILTDHYPLTIPPAGCCVNDDRDGDGYTAATCGGQDHDDDPLSCGGGCYPEAPEICDAHDNDGNGQVDGSISCEDNLYYMDGILPRVISNHSCVNIPAGNRIYCFGGRSYGSPQYLDTIYRYDLQDDSVAQLPISLPEQRSNLSCSYAPSTGNIYCFGGYWQETICTEYNEYGGCISAYAIIHRLNEILVFDPSDETLTPSTTTLPVAYEAMASVWSDEMETIFLIGGTSSVHAGNLDTILEFDPITETILTKTALLPSPRYSLSCAENSQTGKIYCFGGREADGPLAEIVEYDPHTDMLQVMGSSLPGPTLNNSCVEDSIDHLIYCLGGIDGSYNFSDAILAYNPETDTISEKSSLLLPGRYGHKCVEQPSTNQIFCFGGSRNITNLREIIQYIPRQPILGDINRDGQLDLADTITTLKTITGSDPLTLDRKADINEDRKIGLQEGFYQLRSAADM